MAERTITVAGDDYEKLALPVLNVEFPEYERLWKLLVLGINISDCQSSSRLRRWADRLSLR